MADRPVAYIDFETRSEADLKKVGSWRYAEHPSTDAKMMCWAINDDPVKAWAGPCLSEYGITPSKKPARLLKHIQNGGIIEAHNAFFERSIWRNIMVPRLGFPDIPDNQWRCSAARAAAHSLPRGLGKACEVMKIPVQKDDEGHKLMLKLCKPRQQWKKTGKGPKYAGTKEEILRELLYCKRDVEAERALGKAMADLPDHEWQVWMIDQTMNERGVYVDREMAAHIISLIETYRERRKSQLLEMTNGALRIKKAVSRDSLLEWFDSQDYPIPDTKAATLREVVALYPDDIIGQVASICLMLNKSSVSKYNAMLQRASEDGRVRDTLMYHGAGTGRWSGRGVQLQNVARGIVKGKNMESVVDMVLGSELEHVVAKFGDPMPIFSSLVRGAVCAPEGRILRVADYSSIEARGVMWLAGADDAMEVFRRADRGEGPDIYCDMATDVYGYPVEKDKHPSERQLGKQAILGLGYGMGPAKFLATCEGYDIHFTEDMINGLVPPEVQVLIEEDIRGNPIIYFPDGKVDDERVRPLILAKHVVNTYRTKYHEVVQYWRDCEDAAFDAVYDHIAKRPKRWVRAGHKRPGAVYYRVHGKFLFCRLPGKRFIAYPYPHIKELKTSWGTKKKTLCYYGVDSFTRKWTRQKTYGGKLVENITQGVARDIMAEAMVRVESHPDYNLILSVHDELLSECDDGAGSTEELEEMMSVLPDWATGFPLAAEGWSGYRYRK